MINYRIINIFFTNLKLNRKFSKNSGLLRSLVDINATKIRASNPRERVKIIELDYPAAKVPPRTLIQAFEQTVSNYPNNKALMSKNSITGQWDSITYAEYKLRVDRLAKVFIKLGLERNGTVAVLSVTCKEWFIAELATIHAG